MSYSHNIEADFAASELARMFVADLNLCYPAGRRPPGLSASASYEPSASPWPKADGLVTLMESGTATRRDIAIEYKRRQEGIHGLLTAMGQAQAYLHKGYNGAVVVVPSDYPTLPDPSGYVRDVLTPVAGTQAIGVFRYDPPDLLSATPFTNRLHCIRPLQVSTVDSKIATGDAGPKTQWVHMREGSTTRDGFFRFLQMAKLLTAEGTLEEPAIPEELKLAIERIAPGRDPAEYLSNTADSKPLSRIWRAFWFGWIATEDVLTIWKMNGNVYETPNAFTLIEKEDGTGRSQIWEGRAGSLKSSIVEQLNAGAVNEEQAWKMFAAGFRPTGKQNKQGVRDRAHSFREDMDSCLAQLRWIEPDGTPTDYGYHYLSICERYGGANSDAAKEYVGATLLQTGHYASFLHYVHRLSDKIFEQDPLAFTQRRGNIPVFTEASYSNYLAQIETTMAEELKVLRKVSGRNRPRERTPFQVELTLLRNYGFVNLTRHRLGVGIPIDWETVHSALNVEL